MTAERDPGQLEPGQLEPGQLRPGQRRHWDAAPSAANRLVWAAYSLGFRLLRLWWFCRRPRHQGALVAVWEDDQLLLVRPSYRAVWTLPGGGLRAGEAPSQAAARELFEETGLSLPPASLTLDGEYHVIWDHQRDHVRIYAARTDALAAPGLAALRLDGCEIRAARMMTPQQALAAGLPPFLAAYLAGRASPRSAGAGVQTGSVSSA